jgi:hypothetical protein
MKGLVFGTLLANHGVVAQNLVSNCGSATDHLKNVHVSSSGTDPFTFSFSGDLDKDLQEGFFDLDFHVEMAGLINKDIKKVIHWTYTPGVVKGPLSMTIGPVSPPWLPGTNKLTGVLKILDANKEQCSCLSLDLPLESVEAKAVEATKHIEDPIKPCNLTSLHIQNYKKVINGNSIKITGDLDEDVPKFSINLDAHAQVGWFPVPIKLNAPIVYTPGFVKGPFAVSASLPNSLPMASEGDMDVVGTLQVLDQNNEGLVCFKLDIPVPTENVLV